MGLDTVTGASSQKYRAANGQDDSTQKKSTSQRQLFGTSAAYLVDESDQQKPVHDNGEFDAIQNRARFAERFAQPVKSAAESREHQAAHARAGQVYKMNLTKSEIFARLYPERIKRTGTFKMAHADEASPEYQQRQKEIDGLNLQPTELQALLKMLESPQRDTADVSIMEHNSQQPSNAHNSGARGEHEPTRRHRPTTLQPDIQKGVENAARFEAKFDELAEARKKKSKL